MANVIQAAHYNETEQRLASDPVVVAMAAEVVDPAHLDPLRHDDGSPTMGLMTTANAEYATRLAGAGKADDQPRHIGAVAKALCALVDARKAAA